jgi:uncharacterized membrane protein required for colicin V production
MIGTVLGLVNLCLIIGTIVYVMYAMYGINTQRLYCEKRLEALEKSLKRVVNEVNQANRSGFIYDMMQQNAVDENSIKNKQQDFMISSLLKSAGR